MSSFLKNDQIHVSAATPKVKLEGTEASAANLSIRENAGNIEIYDETGTAVRQKIDGASGRRLSPLICAAEIKIKAVVALSDADATLTATQLIDSGIFTITPTVARVLTTDTAANIIAGIPGQQVGTWFDFTIQSLAAFDVTLAAGVGVTLSGGMVLNNVSGTFRCLITSATTVTIYRT